MAEAVASPSPSIDAAAIAAATPVPPATPAAEQPKPAAEAQPKPGDLAQRIAKESEKRAAQEREALRAKVAELEKKAALLERVKKDPRALSELYERKDFDETYDWLTKVRLGDGEAAVDAKLAALEQRLAQQDAEKQARAKEEATAAAERERQAWRSEVATELKASKEFRLVNLHGVHAHVADLIERTHAQDGRVLSTAEAAAAIEAQLRKAVLDSLTDDMLAEYQKSRQPAAAAPAASASREVPKSSATLHNGMTGSAAAASAPLSKAERLKRAEAVLAQIEAARKAGG